MEGRRRSCAAALLLAWLAGGAPALGQQDPLAPDLPATPELQPAAPAPIPSRTIPLPEEEGPAPVSPVLTVDQDSLYLDSAWGLRAQGVLEAEGARVAEENERLTRMLSSEEADLTRQRATLEASEFRRLAEAFDLRATEIRRERAQAVQALNAWADADRSAFLRAALPVMGEVMQQRGAAVVLDGRTVFVSLEGIDITATLIEALDQALGDGAGRVPLPDTQSPHLQDDAGTD